MTQQEFIVSLEEKGIVLSEKQIEQFEKYYEILVEWNEKMNLTAITDREGVYLKHFYDSLTIAFDFPFSNQTICDVGAGAGFPSVPLKIVYPELNVTIVDSLNKRINFLNEVINKLNLVNIETVHSRIEDFGKDKKYRESFDFVTARAVANLAVLSEYLLPIAKVGGQCVCMKGSSVEEELSNGKNAIKVLGGKIKNIDEFVLPDSDMSRNVIIIDKIKNTPNKYPRKAGIPVKEPLK